MWRFFHTTRIDINFIIDTQKLAATTDSLFSLCLYHMSKYGLVDNHFIEYLSLYFIKIINLNLLILRWVNEINNNK